MVLLYNYFILKCIRMQIVVGLKQDDFGFSLPNGMQQLWCSKNHSEYFIASLRDVEQIALLYISI